MAQIDRAAGMGQTGRLGRTRARRAKIPRKRMCSPREQAAPGPLRFQGDPDGGRRQQGLLMLPSQCHSVGFFSLVCLSLADGPFVRLALCLFVSLFACLSPRSLPAPAVCCLLVRPLCLWLPSALAFSLGENPAPGDGGIHGPLPPDLRQALSFPPPEPGSPFLLFWVAPPSASYHIDKTQECGQVTVFRIAQALEQRV